MSGGTFNQAIVIGNLGDAARITRLERSDKQTVIANGLPAAAVGRSFGRAVRNSG